MQQSSRKSRWSAPVPLARASPRVSVFCRVPWTASTTCSLPLTTPKMNWPLTGTSYIMPNTSFRYLLSQSLQRQPFLMYLKGMLGLWSKILEHCFLSTCSRYFVRSLENSFLKLSMNSFNILEVIKHSLDYFLKLCLIISAIYSITYLTISPSMITNQQFLCICKI